MTDTDMAGVCSCDIDYEPWQFYNRSFPRARKKHRCDECLRDIAMGEKYEYAVGKTREGFWQFCTHMSCAGIRRDFCCDIHESVNETFEQTYGFSPWEVPTDEDEEE